jgi:hypothetical protein
MQWLGLSVFKILFIKNRNIRLYYTIFGACRRLSSWSNTYGTGSVKSLEWWLRPLCEAHTINKAPFLFIWPINKRYPNIPRTYSIEIHNMSTNLFRRDSRTGKLKIMRNDTTEWFKSCCWELKILACTPVKWTLLGYGRTTAEWEALLGNG